MLVFQVLYLLDKTPFCSPWVWAAGQSMRRMRGGDMQELESRVADARQRQMAFAKRRCVAFTPSTTNLKILNTNP